MNRYGAAIALEDCAGAEVSGCRGRHGQNGVLLTRSTDCTLTDLDFSFLSGWGLALYRSSNNGVAHCMFDYCVRGYSHGRYWRGQDSAGILVFERSSDNVFVENSATHSGDGVFLYGGNDVVRGRAGERGSADFGGSDRTSFYRNDFSYAVANSIEATFRATTGRSRTASSVRTNTACGAGTRLDSCSCGTRSSTHSAGRSRSSTASIARSSGTASRAPTGDSSCGGTRIRSSSRAPMESASIRAPAHLVAENRFAMNAKDVEITRTDDICFDGNAFERKPMSLSFSGVVVAGENASKLEPRA